MLSFRFLYTLTLAAFTIPSTGLPDGQYLASINEAGEQVIVPFSDDIAARVRNTTDVVPPTTLTRVARSVNAEEEQWIPHCGCGINLDKGNTNSALQGIIGQCGQPCSVKYHEAVFTIAGNVVAFICYAGRTGSDWIISAHEWLDYACGSYVAGSAYSEDGSYLKPVIGYMAYSEGLDFCADSLKSSKRSCET